MNYKSSVEMWGGVSGLLRVPLKHADSLILQGLDRGTLQYQQRKSLVVEFEVSNAFVTQGLTALLNSAFNALAASRITHIGVGGDSSAVTAATTTLGTPNSIKTLNSVALASGVVSGQNDFTQADVADIYRIALLRGTAATSVSSIIGGNGGASPYDRQFRLTATEFTATLQYRVGANAI